MGDLGAAIIDPSFLNVKGDAKKNKLYKKWAKFHLNDEHVSYAARDAYVGYKVYRRVALMHECLVKLEDIASRSNKKKRKNNKNK